MIPTTDYLKALDEQRKELADGLNAVTPDLGLSDTDKFNKINDEVFAHYSVSPFLKTVPAYQYSLAMKNPTTVKHITVTNNGDGTYTINIDFSTLNNEVGAGKFHFIGGKTYRFISTNNTNIEKQNIKVSTDTQSLTITTTVEPRYFVLLILSSAVNASANAFLKNTARAYINSISCFNESDSSTSRNSIITFHGAIQTSVDPYYQIADDGTLSISPAYRGAGVDAVPDTVSDNGAGQEGSKYNELPEILVLPPTFNYAVVSNLTLGMFFGHNRVKKIALPIGTTFIPSNFCGMVTSLKKIYNTKDVTDIANNALTGTQITDIDLSSVKNIDFATFATCRCLKNIKGGSNVESIGSIAFAYTPELKNIDNILDSMKEKGSSAVLKDGAMYLSSIKYDWEQLDNNVVEGTCPTPRQWNKNSYDIWISRQQEGRFTEIINPIPTSFFQADPVFKNENIGNAIGAKDDKKYSAGCAMLSLMHAYCGIRGYTFETPMQVEQQMLHDAEILGNGDKLKTEFTSYSGNASKLKNIATYLGLYTETVKYGENGISTYEQLVDKFYNELQVPGTYYYIAINQGGNEAVTDATNHGECCIGIKSNGDIVMLNSNDASRKPFVLPPQNIYLDKRSFLILREGAVV